MMEERSVPAPVEGRPITAHRGAAADPGAESDQAQASALDDPRALTILTTEHWSLLTARSLVYNEAFTRSGMFLAFLSATLVVLGLVSTATGFSDGFLAIAAILLGLALFIGVASIGRIAAAGDEDVRYLQAMNRLRHAYDEIVPGLRPYLSTSPYDDWESTILVYGPADWSPMRGILHGFTTTPAMVTVICCAVAAGIVAIFIILASHDAFLAAIGAAITFVLALVMAIVITTRAVAAFGNSLEVRFPAPDRESKSQR